MGEAAVRTWTRRDTAAVRASSIRKGDPNVSHDRLIKRDPMADASYPI